MTDIGSIRPSLTFDKVHGLLRAIYHTEVHHLAALGEGQIAQSFSFVVGDDVYVIRFSAENLAHRFRQEQHIAQTYGSPLLPVPLVTQIGEFEGYLYGISEKASGQALAHYPNLNLPTAIANLIVIHDAIRMADVSQTTGYGWMVRDRWAGFHHTWHEHLAFVSEEEPEGMFYHKWHHLFDHTFLDRAHFEALYKRMVALLPACPEERYLVHGGFGFSNVIGHADGTITAVVDWTDARYGDFVLDIAYADYWWDGDIATQAGTHWQSIGCDVPDFRERLLCYQLYFCLDGMRFFAKTTNKAAYDYNLQRVARVTARYDTG